MSLARGSFGDLWLIVKLQDMAHHPRPLGQAEIRPDQGCVPAKVPQVARGQGQG